MNFDASEFADQDYMNLIFLSTDIPNSGEITISDIVLNVDGQTPSISPILSPDSVDYVNMLIQNIWNDDVKTIGYYSVPPTDMSITFTVSGFNYDNPNAIDETDFADDDWDDEDIIGNDEDTTVDIPAADTGVANEDAFATTAVSSAGLGEGVAIAVIVVLTLTVFAR
jgi:hypothetical protein